MDSAIVPAGCFVGQVKTQIRGMARKDKEMGQIYSIEDLRSILSPVFVRYGVKRAVLFGS